MKFILFCLCFLFSNVILASVYTWVDSAGVQHFSAEKQNEALLIKSATKSTLKPLKPSVSTINHAVKYLKLVIIEPQNEETLRYFDGNVRVLVSLEPNLQDGDVLNLLYDGRLFVVSSKDGSFVIPSVERGEHTLQASVKDSAGRILLSSDDVIFYMHQPVVGGN